MSTNSPSFKFVQILSKIVICGFLQTKNGLARSVQVDIDWKGINQEFRQRMDRPWIDPPLFGQTLDIAWTRTGQRLDLTSSPCPTNHREYHAVWGIPSIDRYFCLSEKEMGKGYSLLIRTSVQKCQSSKCLLIRAPVSYPAQSLIWKASMEIKFGLLNLKCFGSHIVLRLSKHIFLLWTVIPKYHLHPSVLLYFTRQDAKWAKEIS